MTLVFMDSFDHYATAGILAKWFGNSYWSIGATGRNGTQGLTMAGNNSGIMGNPFTAHATIIVGFAVKLTAANAGDRLVRIRDGATEHVDLRLDAFRRLYVTRAGTQIGATGATVLVLGAWYFIEFKATIDDAAGAFTVRINGVNEITGAGLDTRNGGNATADNIWLQAPDAGVASSGSYDDLYICTGAGAAPHNDLLGDCRVEALYPAGAGATTAWTPLAGFNWANVDETPPDDDVTYNSSATAGQIDTFAMGNLTTPSGTVFGVQYLLDTRKDDAGVRTIAPVARIGATDYPGATAGVLDAYGLVREIAVVSPATAAAWTVAEVNAAEYGYKLIS